MGPVALRREHTPAGVWGWRRWVWAGSRWETDASARQSLALCARFDRIFRRRTGFAVLGRLLARLHANKAELLMVLCWNARRHRGCFEQALEVLRGALRQRKLDRAPMLWAETTATIGTVHHQLGQLDQTVELYLQGLRHINHKDKSDPVNRSLQIFLSNDGLMLYLDMAPKRDLLADIRSVLDTHGIARDDWPAPWAEIGRRLELGAPSSAYASPQGDPAARLANVKSESAGAPSLPTSSVREVSSFFATPGLLQSSGDTGKAHRPAGFRARTMAGLGNTGGRCNRACSQVYTQKPTCLGGGEATNIARPRSEAQTADC